MDARGNHGGATGDRESGFSDRVAAIRYHRGDLNPDEALPDAVTDDFLLRMYPGRFLTEIEEREDWGRLMQVVAVRRIEYIESLAMQQRHGLIEGSKIKPENWESIRENQRLLEQWLTEADSAESP